MSAVKVSVFFGGLPTKNDEETLKKNCPHVVVGTPGRILALAKSKALNLRYVKHFIVDECDKVVESLGMQSIILRRIYFNIYRYASRCSGNIQNDTT